MASTTWWQYDTSGRLPDGTHPFNQSTQRFVEALNQMREVVEATADKLRNWLEVARRAHQRPRTARRWLRMTSDPLPRSVASRPFLVRRELQRAGPVGYARLGGRRPL